MNHIALTAKYRPQTFAEVAGQETIKTILSRAALEQKVAPAYLFSGTRGVGKTTLARIFAKALNCRSAPVAEPCNQCDQCRSITAGNAVDVLEIDGASNRGIDDIRRLKEVVGYAPMEGGYKIFIIDEAHMLSREAFNALLKTLEEPPARVVFVMATTEPHKFPATIISRCQHHVCKRLPESGLLNHLSAVLLREGVEFEEKALRLIARRASGSVRDSLSLLGQVLALEEGGLTESAVRSVLGLAGQEVFLQIVQACANGDPLALSRLLRDSFAQGLDMGFFLRELASLWRNLFLLRQSREEAFSVVDLPEREARACLEASGAFSLSHIHACWQMTLEGQRRVLTSLEPALALELLLLNLAMLPRLLSLEGLSALGRKMPPPPPQKGRQGDLPKSQGSPAFVSAASRAGGQVAPLPEKVSPTPTQKTPEEMHKGLETPKEAATASDVNKQPGILGAYAQEEAVSFSDSGVPPEASLLPEPDWQELLQTGMDQNIPAWLLSLLRRVDAVWSEGRVILTPFDKVAANALKKEMVTGIFSKLLEAWCGRVPRLEMAAPRVTHKSRDVLRREVLQHPLVKLVQESFDARIVDYGRIDHNPG